jgi:hypothetical protein
MNIVDSYELQESNIDDNSFCVIVAEVVVAHIARTDHGTWYGKADESKTEYPSPLLAAFADANLSDPAYWTE